MAQVKKKTAAVKSGVLKKQTSQDEGTVVITSPLSPIQKMHLSKNGVDKRYLEKVKQTTELDYHKLAKVLSINRATLINKKDDEKFTPTQSERIIGLEALFQLGLDVFQDKDKLNQWLNAPNRALGGQIPYEVMDNQFGREEVQNILGRIQWGVYS